MPNKLPFTRDDYIKMLNTKLTQTPQAPMQNPSLLSRLVQIAQARKPARKANG